MFRDGDRGSAPGTRKKEGCVGPRAISDVLEKRIVAFYAWTLSAKGRKYSLLYLIQLKA